MDGGAIRSSRLDVGVKALRFAPVPRDGLRPTLTPPRRLPFGIHAGGRGRLPFDVDRPRLTVRSLRGGPAST